MARGPRKKVEDKIAEKEELIQGLRTRLKSEQGELEALYREKREKDLEGLNQLLEESGLNLDEAFGIIQEYVQNHASGQQYE